MSGTSLDGLDVCLVRYSRDGTTGRWSYKVTKAQTFPYEQATIDLLKKLPQSSLMEYLQSNIRYSKVVVRFVLEFLKDVQDKVDFISSHGHTVLHQPQNGVSLQCCDPTYLAATTGIDSIGNFRQLDVYRGGQGAPLVPYGSELFPDYEVFLNFGGIVNVDCRGVGWDVGFGNLISNYFAEKAGQNFDRNGELGATGKLNTEALALFQSDEKLSKISAAKSFGREDL